LENQVNGCSFVPKFKGPIEGFVVNYLRKNMWRVSRYLEHEDLMQEARVLFLKLKERYSEVDGMNDRWFMSLFTRSFSNVITNISLKDSKASVEISYGTTSDESDEVLTHLENLVGDVENGGWYSIILQEAPEEVKMVLSVLMNCPAEVLDSVQKSLGVRGGSINNRVLCGLVGLDPKKWDLKQKVLNYLKF